MNLIKQPHMYALAAQLSFATSNLCNSVRCSKNRTLKWNVISIWYIYTYITAAVENNEILFLYFLHFPRAWGMRGSGEIEFNVYSLHDVTVTYLFDIAWMFAYLKVYIHFFILSSLLHTIPAHSPRYSSTSTVLFICLRISLVYAKSLVQSEHRDSLSTVVVCTAARQCFIRNWTLSRSQTISYGCFPSDVGDTEQRGTQGNESQSFRSEYWRV